MLIQDVPARWQVDDGLLALTIIMLIQDVAAIWQMDDGLLALTIYNVGSGRAR